MLSFRPEAYRINEDSLFKYYMSLTRFTEEEKKKIIYVD